VEDFVAEEKGGATPPGGGRMDHEAMRRASELPVHGDAATETLAASGGLELPGRALERPGAEKQSEDADTPELIPGERDTSTFARSTPGIIAGTGFGDGQPSSDLSQTMDEETRHEHEWEGGGKR
jgi:hypothetical protein